MKLAATLVLIALAAAMLGACGDSGDETTTKPAGSGQAGAPPGARATDCPKRLGPATDVSVTGVSCEKAAEAIQRWVQFGCLPTGDESRAGCEVKPFRCVTTVTDRGFSVSCAAPGRSVAFTVPRP